MFISSLLTHTAPTVTSHVQHHIHHQPLPQSTKKPQTTRLNTSFGLEVCFFWIIYMYYLPTTSQHQPLSTNRHLTRPNRHQPPTHGPNHHLHQPLPQSTKKTQTTRLNASFGLQVCDFKSPISTQPNTRTNNCTCVRLTFVFFFLSFFSFVLL